MPLPPKLTTPPPRSAPSFLVAPAASPPHRLVAGLAGRCFQIQVPAQGGGAGTHAGGGAPTTINAVRLVEAASGQCYLTSIIVRRFVLRATKRAGCPNYTPFESGGLEGVAIVHHRPLPQHANSQPPPGNPLACPLGGLGTGHHKELPVSTSW